MIKIRKGTINDAYGIARVQVKGWHTTYNGIVPDKFLNQMSIEEQEKKLRIGLTNKQRKERFFVAENDKSEIVGYIIGGENRYSEEYPDCGGELYAIYILKNYQRDGLGRKLVQTLVDWLKDNKFNQMLVWVIADNPAKYFYEKLGAKYLGEKQLEIEGKKLDEYVYIWDDLKHF